jgi:hypothetical protein
MEGVTQRSSSLAFLHNSADKGCVRRLTDIAFLSRFDSLSQLLVMGRPCRPPAIPTAWSQQF